MRCETCGRKTSGGACGWRALHTYDPGASPEDEERQPATCVIVWSRDRRALEALVAQWPGAVEWLETMTHEEQLEWWPDTAPYDEWGARLSTSEAAIGLNPVAEYALRGGRLRKLDWPFT
jgi:hypothetical protein